MDNKKVVSHGLIAFSSLFALNGLALAISPFKDMFDKLIAHKPLEFPLFSLIWCILGFYLIVCGAGLANHKEWARKNALVYSFISSLSVIILITSEIVFDVSYDTGFLVLFPSFIVYAVALYFLSRPTVKRAFN